MKSKYAAQIRKGIRFAQNWGAFPSSHRATLYRIFMTEATYLEWQAFTEYKLRHFGD